MLVKVNTRLNYISELEKEYLILGIVLLAVDYKYDDI